MPRIIDHGDGWGNCSIDFKRDVNNPQGVFNLHRQINLLSHRSGWNYVNELLTPYHNSNAPIFDGFIEKTFSWFKDHYKYNGMIPRNRPWTAFLHNPHNMPEWFNYVASPQTMFASPEFQDSLPTCEGIFVLSDWLNKWLSDQFPYIPIETVYHPGPVADIQFDFKAFLNNSDKQIVAIGWWLRKMSSIYLLPVQSSKHVRYSKCRTLPYQVDSDPVRNMLDPLLDKEIHVLKIEEQVESMKTLSPVVTHYKLSNLEYDLLLSKNIGFIDVWDSSANNTVIECIGRATPLLACKHPAIVEYLGENYPLYFDDHDHAVSLLQDLELIRETHEYMKSRQWFISSDRFINSIMSSTIVDNIKTKYL